MKYEKRRHPAEMTSLRLGQAEEWWPGRFTEAERDAITAIHRALRRIRDEDEQATGREGFDAFAVLYARDHAPSPVRRDG